MKRIKTNAHVYVELYLGHVNIGTVSVSVSGSEPVEKPA